MTLEIQQQKSLRNLNTFGLPATAEYFASARSEEEVREALALAREKKLAVTVLGGGSNVVFSRDIAGLVLQVAIPGILFEGESVQAGAGEAWHQVVLASLEQGLCGIENLSLIPGSAGAAPIQNIGAYGSELEAVFVSLSAIDRDTLVTHTFEKSDCRFGYRDSIFKGELKDRLVITRISVLLSHTFLPNLSYEGLRRHFEESGEEVTARSVSDAVCRIRRSKLPDPARLGNAGSFFKNPVIGAAHLEQLLAAHPAMPYWRTASGCKVSAGWLIEQSGLKGQALGGAAVLDSHALVLVNHRQATGKDVLELAHFIQDEVRRRFDITLEIEPVVY